MGNLDRSRLAKELEPYIASQIRSALNAALGKAALPTLGGSGGVIGITPPAVLTSHVLATATGLGTYHSISGATAGHVLRASGATTALFAQLQHGDLGGVSANQHHNQSHAYNSSDHTGTLSWAKINFTGSSLGDLATRSYTHLQGAGALYDVVAWSSTDTITKLTPSADVSAGTSALLRSNGGVLGLLSITSVANITMGPLTAVLPTGSILKDLGDYNRKWRSLYAAELYVETLVAQDVLATIGGRIMVAPTTKLIADLAAGGTTIDVEHNNLTSAFVYMASAPGGMAQVEVMKCGATATPIAGGYRYTVTRNLDGSGTNAWVAGDAIANIGAVAGQGWIELTSTNTARNHLGPTIAIYARTGMAAWTDVKPVVALGNLRSFVDYAADQYGFALGNDLDLLPTTGFSGMTGDRTNGLRLFNTDIELYASGTKFAWIDTTDGFTIVPSDDWQELRAYSFSNGTTTWGGMFAKEDISTFRSIRIQNVGSQSGKQYEIIILAQGQAANGPASVLVQALGGGASDYSATLSLTADIANNNKGIAYLQAGFTTLELDGATDVATLTANTLVLDASVLFDIYHGGARVFRNHKSGESQLTVGAGRTADGNSMLDFISAAAGSVDLRIIRNTGVNGVANILQYGTGALRLTQVGGGDVEVWLDAAARFRFSGTDFSVLSAGGTATAPLVNATTTFQRDGVDGGIFVPVSAFYMQDNNAVTWNGAAGRNIGTYVFNPQAAANNSLPAEATAIVVAAGGKWTGSASDGKYILGRGVGMTGGQSPLTVRHQVANVTTDAFAVIPVGTNGDFQMDVVGENAAIVYVRCIGYFM